MSFTQRRIGSIEPLEQRRLMAADSFEALLPQVETEPMIYVRIGTISDDAAIDTDGSSEGNWFIADSFSFGVEREMKESSDAPVQADAETQDLVFDDLGEEEGKPICYLAYKLDRAFVKSWSVSGDADDQPTEEVAFYYNKIAANYTATLDGGDF